MIQTNELRIGNLVEKDGEIYVADFITIKMAHNYNPIPLTEEWLLKFGFEKLTDSRDGFNNSSYTYTKGISFIVHFDGVRLSTNFWIGNEKKYVHQLQNLYFALTNTELIIKNH